MFGYLPAPCRCQIGSQVDLYRSTFCGLCNALAAEYGQLARLLVNRDATFLALLTAAQCPDSPPVSLSRRCQPWRRPMPVFEHGPVPTFTAAVTLCALGAKLDDERVDEGKLRASGSRWLSSVARSRLERAQDHLVASGFPVAAIAGRLEEQARIEAQVREGREPHEAAEPSARAFGAILAHTARLADRHANAVPLRQVGEGLGELVYTLDAFEDLEEDARRGRFNYFSAPSRQVPNREAIRDRARGLISDCEERIHRAWQNVEVVRYRPVLEAVLLTGLSRRNQLVLAGAPGGVRDSPAGPLRIEDPEGAHRRQPWCGGDAVWCCSGDCGQCCNCGECCACCDPESCSDCGSCEGGDAGCCCDCGNCDCGGCDCSG